MGTSSTEGLFLGSLQNDLHLSQIILFTLIDYSTFASPSFDPNEYANAILAGEPYPHPQKSGAVPPTPGGTLSRSTTLVPSRAPITSSSSAAGQEDISVALAKLNFGIDDVSKQLRGVVRYRLVRTLPTWLLILFSDRNPP